ncbi:MAG: hypothetical protein QOE86_1018 [Solirubrobacteraceae bacterium]|nr:hypothetical protein [Solirubrobacteraceae bacterium]
MARRPYGAPVIAPPAPGQRQVKPARADALPPVRLARVSARILIVEDDEAIASGLRRVLDSQGYDVRCVARGRPALDEAAEPTALVVLDLGLPDVDGIEVCRRLRAARPDLAIIILTARDQELDVVAGLDAGADDYLVKPFRLAELLARVRAHLRRAAAPPGDGAREPPLRAGEIRVDVAARRAWRGDVELDLRPKEFDLLSLLVAEAGRVVTRERIMHDVWDTEWMGSTKTLDTHVLALRGKLGPDAITTLRGVGYRFDGEPEASG